MGLIGSGMGLSAVTWSKPPAEHPVSRMTRRDVRLSLVRAPALPPQHADFGSQCHTPSNRCLRFGPRVAATPARRAPVLPARLWTDQTFTGKLIPAFLSYPAYGSPTRFMAGSRDGVRTTAQARARQAKLAENRALGDVPRAARRQLAAPDEEVAHPVIEVSLNSPVRDIVRAGAEIAAPSPQQAVQRGAHLLPRPLVRPRSRRGRPLPLRSGRGGSGG